MRSEKVKQLGLSDPRCQTIQPLIESCKIWPKSIQVSQIIRVGPAPGAGYFTLGGAVKYPAQVEHCPLISNPVVDFFLRITESKLNY